jgi:hypothetical protein
MTPIQENISNNHLQEENTIENISHKETLDDERLDTEINDKMNNQEDAEQVNGFELFMQNTKGNFSRLIGCGG